MLGSLNSAEFRWINPSMAEDLAINQYVDKKIVLNQITLQDPLHNRFYLAQLSQYYVDKKT